VLRRLGRIDFRGCGIREGVSHRSGGFVNCGIIAEADLENGISGCRRDGHGLGGPAESVPGA
jgi:hypothetical protein